MTRRDDLNALAARVEALMGPCRETDARIWCALNGKKYGRHFEIDGINDRNLTQVEYTEPPKRRRLVTGNTLHNPHARNVTASLDAAMTLAPSWALPCLYYCPDETGAVCEMRNGIGIPFKGYRAVSRANHPFNWSNAITAASLRAIAAQEPTE